MYANTAYTLYHWISDYRMEIKMKFQISNITKNKVCLTAEFENAACAAGKYISALFVAGLVTHCERDVKFTDETHFRILSKGWDFEVAAI